MSASYQEENTKSLSQVWYRSIVNVLNNSVASVQQKYDELFAILCDVLYQHTKDEKLLHNGTLSKLNDVCRRYKIPHFYVNEFRVHYRQLSNYATDELENLLLYDAKSLVDLILGISGDTIPDELAVLLPSSYKTVERQTFVADYLRVFVTSCDDTYIYGFNNETAEELKIILNDADSYFGNFEYFNKLLKNVEGCQINLIRPTEKEGVLYPELIIYEPDYLTDISLIASCFDVYANSPYVSLINKLNSDSTTSAILLGNFASQMLDEEINSFASPLEYKESARKFYKSNALSLATCEDYEHSKFHKQAMEQQINLRGMLRSSFTSTALKLDSVILEPSFFCEKLGIQGRMDLLQEDFKVLMEQKSGKWDDFRREVPVHREPHYVQMLLYLALLHYNFDLKYSDIECYLLYSKYSNGLIREHTAPRLLFEALKIRNQLVWLEYNMLSVGKARELFEALTPERLNTKCVSNRLWYDFVYPRLNGVLSTLKSATSLEKSYFYRMFSFLSYEHLLGKIGTPKSPGSGFASLWLDTVQEKLESGNIVIDLHLCEIEGIHDEGISTLKLQISASNSNLMPNFRMGDIVVLYYYNEGTTPDVRKSIAYRCTIKKISLQHVVVQLHAPQKNRHLFENTTYSWALEHDYMEASSTSLFRQLMCFLKASDYRKRLVLTQIEPSFDNTKQLLGDYGEFNDLVLKSKQANDYFILVGPPGTGKTTKGLVNVLKEELLDTSSNVLLLSFTNKAVDEICSKLVGEGIDFVRLGGNISCAPEYHDYLLINKIDDIENLAGIKEFVQKMRVFVSTTTTMNRNLQLFNLKKFSMAIVDEASQIIEPQLLDVISSKGSDNVNSVGKFVFIGDHKQLPAVVQQSRKDSQVNEEELINIGLLNCADSLFERLYRHNVNNEHVVYMLDKQARMHPTIAAFPSSEFYHGRLMTRDARRSEPVLNYYNPTNLWHVLLKNYRLAFVDVVAQPKYLSAKVNTSEAEVIADVVKAVIDMYVMNNQPFNPSQVLGVIVPYRHQIAEVRSLLEEVGKDVVIDTVERFQGGERDVMIYGTTIRNYNQLEFLCSNIIEEDGVEIDRKLNVALTRARSRLVVVGNSSLLRNNKSYRHMIDFIKQNGKFVKLN